MSKYFEPEFKKKIVRLHLEDGRTIRSLAMEYSISKASIYNRVSRFRKECQNNEEAKADYDYMKENLNLKKQLAELQSEIKSAISNIYHSHKEVDGYRTIHAYLTRKGYRISRLTVHKYMNTELKLYSIVRKRKPAYEYGEAHKVFKNKLVQDFKADYINQKWCTDFTYLALANSDKRYNCSIIDLYDRSIVASITGKHIIAALAKETLQKAIYSQPRINTRRLMLHSDQGSRYTSKEFTQILY